MTTTVKKKIENGLLKSDFLQLSSPHSQLEIDTIGNRMRKKFEILLYEFSKLTMIGSVEDSRKIIDRILSQKPVYYASNQTASDLVDKIQSILNQNISFNLSKMILLINFYKICFC